MALTFLTGIKGVYFYSYQDKLPFAFSKDIPNPLEESPEVTVDQDRRDLRETLAKILSLLENQTFTMAYEIKLDLFHEIGSD
ncbi:hypothetical protein [Paraburkholderia tropica]|uniref:hypothetical protein n=1 Tax=Paraburkholderia tropica TaxID=92647 RepID=UPI002AB787E1|nr:hypothetical protein [Paraburkholderia tropica]